MTSCCKIWKHFLNRLEVQFSNLRDVLHEILDKLKDVLGDKLNAEKSP